MRMLTGATQTTNSHVTMMTGYLWFSEVNPNLPYSRTRNSISIIFIYERYTTRNRHHKKHKTLPREIIALHYRLSFCIKKRFMFHIYYNNSDFYILAEDPARRNCIFFSKITK